MNERSIYRLLTLWNDAKAVRRAARIGSAAPIGRGVARRVYGRLAGRLARRLFR